MIINSIEIKKGFKNFLNFYSMFFYPGIILSACWTILNIVKMVNYKSVLNSEHPECT